MRPAGKVLGAIVLLAGVWKLGTLPESITGAWIRPVGAPPGPVRILRFYANTASVAAGDKARLCYGVENAKSVRISPSIATVAPAVNRCFEIVAERTTHYTMLAEGYDGNVAARFLTLIVQQPPEPEGDRTNVAEVRLPFRAY